MVLVEKTLVTNLSQYGKAPKWTMQGRDQIAKEHARKTLSPGPGNYGCPKVVK